MVFEHSRSYKFSDPDILRTFLGKDRVTLKCIERLGLRTRLTGRKMVLKASSQKDLELAEALVGYVLVRAHQGKPTTPAQVDSYMKKSRPSSVTVVTPKTAGQGEYLDCIRRHDIVFGLGPAGTGKTFLAVAAAVDAFNRREVSKIVITRPAVEAGERLGFLPGTFAEKVDPYLRPVTDALETLLGRAKVEQLKRNGEIEVAPLAYMRGRTLENAYILLDEAQNCTFKQLTMLLTRIGEGSKCIVNGDTSQVDLERQSSGLSEMVRTLASVREIGIYEFTTADVVRHPIVAKIIDAIEYAQNERKVVAIR